MKKTFVIMLAALTVFCGAFAELDSAPLLPMEGIVLEISEDGSYLINTIEHGDVQVFASDETYLETSRDISIGDYLYIADTREVHALRLSDLVFVGEWFL